eukprot:6995577-Prymnesium_polylepis.1
MLLTTLLQPPASPAADAAASYTTPLNIDAALDAPTPSTFDVARASGVMLPGDSAAAAAAAGAGPSAAAAVPAVPPAAHPSTAQLLK